MMQHSRSSSWNLLLVLVVSLFTVAMEGDASADSPPNLVPRQGNVFRWQQPADWSAQETPNGLDLKAPDGSTVLFGMLLRNPGSATPEQFLQLILRQFAATGATGIQILQTRRLPDQPSGYPGVSWRSIEAEISLVDHGTPRLGVCVTSTSSYYGLGYDATFTGYGATSAEWPRMRNLLANVSSSIAITNTMAAAGNTTLIPPRNHPADDSAIMGAWENRRQSQDRTNQGFADATRGHTTWVSPEDGSTFTLDNSQYDSTNGQMRDPRYPGSVNHPLQLQNPAVGWR